MEFCTTHSGDHFAALLLSPVFKGGMLREEVVPAEPLRKLSKVDRKALSSASITVICCSVSGSASMKLVLFASLIGKLITHLDLDGFFKGRHALLPFFPSGGFGSLGTLGVNDADEALPRNGDHASTSLAACGASS
jgi:hypothetical protein